MSPEVKEVEDEIDVLRDEQSVLLQEMTRTQQMRQVRAVRNTLLRYSEACGQKLTRVSFDIVRLLSIVEAAFVRQKASIRPS